MGAGEQESIDAAYRAGDAIAKGARRTHHAIGPGGPRSLSHCCVPRLWRGVVGRSVRPASKQLASLAPPGTRARALSVCFAFTCAVRSPAVCLFMPHAHMPHRWCCGCRCRALVTYLITISLPDGTRRWSGRVWAGGTGATVSCPRQHPSHQGDQRHKPCCTVHCSRKANRRPFGNRKRSHR